MGDQHGQSRGNHEILLETGTNEIRNWGLPLTGISMGSMWQGAGDPDVTCTSHAPFSSAVEGIFKPET